MFPAMAPNILHKGTGVALTNEATLDDARVEGKRPVKPLDDAPEDAMVLLKRVRVERRHHTAVAKIREGDRHAADSQMAARPCAFLQPGDAANDQVGSKATAVVAERGDRAVGRDQQGKDVETIDGFVANKPRAVAD